MKISEMTNAQAKEVMIRLADPIGRLCDDEQAVELIEEYKKNLRKPLYYVVGRMIPRLVGYLMKEHERDVYEIVSILTGEPLKEMASKNFKETVEAIRDSYDDVLDCFFSRSGGSSSTAGIR